MKRLTQAQKNARRPLLKQIRNLREKIKSYDLSIHLQRQYTDRLHDRLRETEASLTRVLNCEPGTKPYMDAQNAKGSNAYVMGKVKIMEGIGPNKPKGIQ